MSLKFSESERHVLITKAGLYPQLLDAWERGACNPNKDNALIIVEWTGRDLVDVLYGRNPGEKNNTNSAA